LRALNSPTKLTYLQVQFSFPEPFYPVVDGFSEDEFFCVLHLVQLIVPPPLLNSSFVLLLSPGNAADTMVWGEDGGEGLLPPFWSIRIARETETERRGMPSIELGKQREEEEKTAGEEEAWLEHDEKRERMFVISEEVYFRDRLQGERREERRGVRDERRRREYDPRTMDNGFRRDISHSHGSNGRGNLILPSPLEEKKKIHTQLEDKSKTNLEESQKMEGVLKRAQDEVKRCMTEKENILEELKMNKHEIEETKKELEEIKKELEEAKKQILQKNKRDEQLREEIM
jgi:hypothetical protein